MRRGGRAFLVGGGGKRILGGRGSWFLRDSQRVRVGWTTWRCLRFSPSKVCRSSHAMTVVVELELF